MGKLRNEPLDDLGHGFKNAVVVDTCHVHRKLRFNIKLLHLRVHLCLDVSFAFCVQHAASEIKHGKKKGESPPPPKKNTRGLHRWSGQQGRRLE